ncbi:MAG: hypothetical protein IPL61_11035 [Myxococcales bacterium]|nr:hypothetical protein [Myxococcales bacterium]
MTYGYLQATLRCRTCMAITRIGFKSNLVDDPFAVLTLGAPIDDGDLHAVAKAYLHTKKGASRRESADVTILEQAICSVCGAEAWCQVRVIAGTLTAITPVVLTADVVNDADFIAEAFAWEFERVTGESPFGASGYRVDWHEVLERHVMLGTHQLERSTPRINRQRDDPGRFLAYALEAPADRTVNVLDDVSEIPGWVSDLDDLHDYLAIEVSPFADTGRPAWMLVRRADLVGFRRQGLVLDGAPVAVDEAEDAPCGATIHGAWTLVTRVRGAADRGSFLAMSRDARYALATMTSRQREPLDRVRASLQRGGPAVAPLIAVTELRTRHDDLVVLLEVEPEGQPLSCWWIPLDATGVAELATSLFHLLSAADGALGGLRPETIFAENEPATPFTARITGVAPRGEAFMAGQAPRSVGSVTPYRYLYDAPEVLRGGPPTLAGDVFAATAVVAHMATGAHPFEGESAFMQLSAIVAGQRRAYHGPPGLEALIARGLAADPAQRPSAAELAAAFAQAAPLPPG